MATVAVTLTNNDRRDADFVCVTTLFQDISGTTLAAQHQNVRIEPVSSTSVEQVARGKITDQATTIQVGTKQCRQGPHEDDAVFEAVVSRL
jgi:hypothetical protein